MTTPTYLVKNPLQTYYFRFVIPVRFRHRFPNHKREIRKSLKTRNHRVALDRARRLRVKIGYLMNMSDIDKMDLEIEELDSGLNLLEKLNRASRLSDKHDNQNILDEFFYNLSPRETKQLKTAISHKEGLTKEQLSTTPKVSTSNKTENTTSLREKIKQTTNTLSELQKQLKLEEQGISTEESNVSAEEESFRLSNIVESFLRDKKVNVTNQKTLDTYERQCNLLIKIIGDKLVDKMGVKDIRKFKDTLPRLPKNLNHSPLYRDKSISKILEMDIPSSDRLSPITIKNIVINIKIFLSWGKSNFHFDFDYSGMFKEIAKKKKRDDEHRNIFSKSDLDKLFSTQEYQQVGGFKKYPFRYWIPLLALYTGCRLEEICQLHISDIQKEDGIHIISINSGSDKSLKNKSSERIIPIHKELLNLGFLGFVKSVKQMKQDRLFHNLSPDTYGKYGRKASRFFNEKYKEHVGGFITYSGVSKSSDKGKKDFHSFRHTFVDRAKQLELNDRVIKEIVGHSTGDITFNTYGKDYNISMKKKEINKINFGIKKHPHKW